MKKKIMALIMAGVIAASLAACGGNSGAASTDSAAEEKTEEAAEEEAATEEAAAEEPTAEAGAVSEYLADGVLTVGTNPEFPPFEYMGDDGNPDGFDIALINAIGEKLGVDVVVESYNFNSLVESIGSKIDVSIAGMTVTEERKQAVDFSDSYYEAIQSVIVKKDSAIASADDLKGKSLGCQLGTTGDFIIQDIEGAENHQYDRGVDAVNDLLNDKVEAVIIDRNPAAVFQAQYPDDLKIISGEDFGCETELYAIAMPKGDTALADAINGALAELKADGTFDKLVEEYINE